MSLNQLLQILSTPEVELRSSAWSPLITFLKHLTSLDIMKEYSAFGTLESLLIVFQVDQHMPQDITKAISSIQDIAENRSDSGLASVVLGLAQGKALLLKARHHAEDAKKATEFLTDLVAQSDKASSLGNPDQNTDGWSEFEKVITSGSNLLHEALSKSTSTDVTQSIISKSKSVLGEFACATCYAFIQKDILSWVGKTLKLGIDMSKDKADNVPSLGLDAKKGKFSALGNQANDILTVTQDLETALGVVHRAWNNSKDGSLETSAAVNFTKEFDVYLAGSGSRLAGFKLITEDQLQHLKDLARAVLLPLSDSRVANTSKEYAKALVDLMVKAKKQFQNIPRHYWTYHTST